MITDPIADMLTRIRNSLVARHDFTDMPASKVRVALAQVLKKEGYIGDFEVREEGSHRNVRVHLAYTPAREPVIMGLKRVSRPGLGVSVFLDQWHFEAGPYVSPFFEPKLCVMTGQEA